VEKSFWAGGLAPRRGHGYDLEEYAIRRRSTIKSAMHRCESIYGCAYRQGVHFIDRWKQMLLEKVGGK